MVSKDKFLEVKDLTVEYISDGSVVHAVGGVSFELSRGEILGLVGETGAGKTTIAKSILGILPAMTARVTGGSIFFEGVDLLKKTEKEMLEIRGNKISMIFQDPMSALNPVMSVGSQIAEVISLHNHINGEKARTRAIAMLEMVGIPAERYEEFPHQFSGGMKQRVIIAMALSCDPQLLLADDPTTALDVTIQAQVLDMITDLKRKFHTAMVLITHDLGVIAETCDQVAVVYAGQIVEAGTKRDIFKDTRHPYTQGLFDSIPKMGGTEKWLKTINGMPPDPTDLPQGCVFASRCPRAEKACSKAAVPAMEVTPGHYCRCLFAKEVKGVCIAGD